jgi:hypothetical protein
LKNKTCFCTPILCYQTNKTIKNKTGNQRQTITKNNKKQSTPNKQKQTIMKTRKLKTIAMMAMAILTLSVSATSCSKTGDKPVITNPPDTTNGGTHGGTDSSQNPNPGPVDHYVDPKLVGTWMWTSAGDQMWYDNNGTYTGPSYGLALEYKINADGTGTSLSHFTSTLGSGTGMEVNIASTGFYESDDQAHFGYFPLSGSYESVGASGGEDRDLNSTEVYDPATGTGKYYVYQKLVFGEVNGRKYLEVTSSENITDRYWKVE